eukprot:3196788-Pyramimonas_sp.AAC.3
MATLKRPAAVAGLAEEGAPARPEGAASAAAAEQAPSPEVALNDESSAVQPAEQIAKKCQTCKEAIPETDKFQTFKKYDPTKPAVKPQDRCSDCHNARGRVLTLCKSNEEFGDGFEKMTPDQRSKLIADAKGLFNDQLSKVIEETVTEYKTQRALRNFSSEGEMVDVDKLDDHEKFKNDPAAKAHILEHGIKNHCEHRNKEQVWVPTHFLKLSKEEATGKESKRKISCETDVKIKQQRKGPGNKKKATENGEGGGEPTGEGGSEPAHPQVTPAVFKRLESGLQKMESSVLTLTTKLVMARAPENADSIPKKTMEAADKLLADSEAD